MIFGIIIGNYSANIVINIKPFGMKNNTFSDRIIPFVSKTALALASGLFLVSCGVQSGYTETDGIYYDPATDKIERKNNPLAKTKAVLETKGIIVSENVLFFIPNGLMLIVIFAKLLPKLYQNF